MNNYHRQKKYRTLRNSFHREAKGFALVATMVIGVCSLALLLAIGSNVLNVYTSEAVRRHNSELRGAAEAGIEYAIGELGKCALTGQICSLDPSDAQTSKITNLPSSILAATSGSSDNSRQINKLQILVKVKKFQLIASELGEFKKWSSLYSPQLDPTLSLSSSFETPKETNVNQVMWRVIECRAAFVSEPNDINSPPLASKTIRVVLDPVFDLPRGNEAGFAPPSTQNYFQNGAFGNHSLNVSGASVAWAGIQPTKPDSQGNPKFKLSISSNRLINLTAANVKGDVLIPNNQLVQSDSGKAIIVSNSSVIEGRLLTNGESSSDTAVNSGISANPGDHPQVVPVVDNVLAEAAGVGVNRLGDNNRLPQDNNAGLVQSGLAPAPSGRDAQPLPDLGAVAASDGPLTSNTGDWSTSSLTTNSVPSGSQIAVSDKFGSGDGSPTRIFVNDSSLDANGSSLSSSPAVDLSAYSFSHTTDPSSLQIWYQGKRDINIHLDQDFAGTIYAPFAKVNFDGTKNFTGAVAGKEVNMNSTGDFKLLSGDFSDSSAGPNGGIGLKYSYDSNAGTLLPTGYRVVTWQETGVTMDLVN